MRWSYKTVHYEMKKEGLLGSAFLDESEIELSLNEYGKAGWELVSMLETLDGLIAVFKQPLSLGNRSFRFDDEDRVDESISTRLEEDKEDVEVEPLISEEIKERGEVELDVVPIDEYEVVVEEPEEEEALPQSSGDVGAIRIE